MKNKINNKTIISNYTNYPVNKLVGFMIIGQEPVEELHGPIKKIVLEHMIINGD